METAITFLSDPRKVHAIALSLLVVRQTTAALVIHAIRERKRLTKRQPRIRSVPVENHRIPIDPSVSADE
jgi:hypothetical protein